MQPGDASTASHIVDPPAENIVACATGKTMAGRLDRHAFPGETTRNFYKAA
jgi:hypothetical protein